MAKTIHDPIYDAMNYPIPYPKIWSEPARDLCPSTLSRFSKMLHRHSPKKTPPNNMLLLEEKDACGIGHQKANSRQRNSGSSLLGKSVRFYDNQKLSFQTVVLWKYSPLFLPPPLTEIREAARSKAAHFLCTRHAHIQANIHDCRPRPSLARVFSDMSHHVANSSSALAYSFGPKPSIAHNARQTACHVKLTLSISVYLNLEPRLSTLAYGKEAVGSSTEQVRKRCDIPRNIALVSKHVHYSATGTDSEVNHHASPW